MSSVQRSPATSSAQAAGQVDRLVTCIAQVYRITCVPCKPEVTPMSALHRNATAVALIAGAIFALGLGVRQSQALFIGPINSSTGIGYASISLAFAVGQLMWGVAMPVAGALADRYSARTVMVIGALMVSAATAL